MAPASTTPTLAACLTPPGTGAIATLAVQGPRAWEVASALFRPFAGASSWPPADPDPGGFWIGRLGDQAKTAGADEVVLALLRWTPLPRVEIHCHGGVEVVRWLLEILQARGVQACSWQNLERQTSSRPVSDAALACLIDARTPRAAGILLEQYRGALDAVLTDVDNALKCEDLAKAGRLLGEVIRFGAVGRHLTAPWRVAILGAPNVGKSSLVNALAGYQRSVVAPTPGTTRDVVTTLIAVDGWPVELADTAGLRAPAEALEGQGIELARQAAQDADLCLWVLDAAAPPSFPEPGPERTRLIVNKIDLPTAWDLQQAAGAVAVSARTGAGIGGLCEALARWLVPDPPPPGAAVPFTPAIAETLERAQRACDTGQAGEALRVLAELRDGPPLPVTPG